MENQWEFYKIAGKSTVSINNQAKTFLDDQLDGVLYFMKNSVWVPGMNFDSTCITAHSDQRQPLKASAYLAVGFSI